jgi:hypothetical protein
LIRRNSEAAQRAAERRRKEDDAARLHAEIPRLATLKLELEERRGGSAVGGTGHIRHIVVDSAPALFIIPCSERNCVDGGHDLTRDILDALERAEVRFEGEHACRGHVGNIECENVLRYTGVATFSEE